MEGACRWRGHRTLQGATVREMVEVHNNHPSPDQEPLYAL
jgi:hypothetical protein